MVLRIDAAPLRTLIRRPEDMAGQVIVGSRPGLTLLEGYLRAFLVTRFTLTPALMRSFGLHVVDLVASILGPARDGMTEAAGVRSARLRAVLSTIAAEATDPHFTPDALAVRVGVTRRYVHRLLEESGETFSGHVLAHRLGRAWRLLSDPNRSDMKIASIAYDCGFNDLSTFNRTFRRRFGETPTAVRGTHTPPPAQGRPRGASLAERLARPGRLQ